MLWYCGYRSLPGVRASQLARRLLRQHDAGSNRPADLRGWFTFPSGTAGFVLVEAETPRDLAPFLDPYSEFVQWRVEAAFELNYSMFLEEQRHSTYRAAVDDLMAGVPPAVVAEGARRS
jgi:hypothetical protein